MVRFTPAVYKFLLEEKCSLDDLRVEDPTLHEYVTQSTFSVFVYVVCVVCVCACRSKEKNTDYNVYVLHTHTLI